MNNKIFIASWVSEDQNQWLTIAIQEGKKKKKTRFSMDVLGVYFSFTQMYILSTASDVLTFIIVWNRKAASGNLGYKECRVNQQL